MRQRRLRPLGALDRSKQRRQKRHDETPHGGEKAKRKMIPTSPAPITKIGVVSREVIRIPAHTSAGRPAPRVSKNRTPQKVGNFRSRDRGIA